MSKKEITIRKLFTRDQLLQAGAVKDYQVSGPKQNYSAINTGHFMTLRLLDAGIPVVGFFGVLAVEWGRLTITHDDGIDCDEWLFEWTGVPMPKGWPKREVLNSVNQPRKLRLDRPLIEQIRAEDDEL